MGKPFSPTGNSVSDMRKSIYTFTNVTLVQNADKTIKNATLLIEDGKIKGVNVAIPNSAITIDLKGKYIYHSFIDIYSNYGVEKPTSASGRNYYAPLQFESNEKGTMGWNQAIKPQFKAANLWIIDMKKLKILEKLVLV